jgi:hypothetical protein
MLPSKKKTFRRSPHLQRVLSMRLLVIVPKYLDAVPRRKLCLRITSQSSSCQLTLYMDSPVVAASLLSSDFLHTARLTVPISPQLGQHFACHPLPTRMANAGSSGFASPRRITITDSNLNPILQIVTWLLLAFTALALSFRLFTNIIVKGRMPVSPEDLLFLSAFVCFVVFYLFFIFLKKNLIILV